MINNVELTVNTDAFFAYLGMDDPSSRFQEAVEDLSELALDASQPRASYRILPVESVRGGVLRCRLPEGSGSLELSVGRISIAFQKAPQVVVFLVTIGEAVDRITRRLQHEGQVFKSSFFDSICSYLVDDFAAVLQEEISLQFPDLHPTHRFSPGYCDWDLSEQTKLFSLFSTRPTGIELNGSCAMSPRKSVSGIFGLSFERQEDTSPCRMCRHDCSYRRVPAEGDTLQ